jgi:O-antigen/teichoic acid export membrane protein
MLKTSLRQIGIVGLSNILLSIRGLILLPTLTKFWGPFDFGIMSLVSVTISLAIPFTTLGLRTSLSRFLISEKSTAEVQEAFFSTISCICIASLFIAGILIIFSKEIAIILFKDEIYASFLIITAFLIIFQSLIATSLSFFPATKRIVTYAIFINIQNILEIIIIVFLVFSGFGVLEVLEGLLISNIIIFLLFFSYIIYLIGFKVPNFSKIFPYLKFGLPLVPSILFIWVIGSSGTYLIGYYFNLTLVGIYSTAYAIGNILYMFFAPISLILLPTIAHLWDSGNNKEIDNHLSYSIRYYLLLTIPAVFGLSILSQSLILIFSTAEFLPGAIVIPFVASGLIFFGLHSIISSILTSKLRTDLITFSLFLGSIINIILNILLLPRLGILGAAISSLITYFTVFMVAFYYSQKFFIIHFDYLFISKCIFSSILMSLAIYFFKPISILQLVLIIILGIGVYLIGLYSVKGITKNEILGMFDMIGIDINKIINKLLLKS